MKPAKVACTMSAYNSSLYGPSNELPSSGTSVKVRSYIPDCSGQLETSNSDRQGSGQHFLGIEIDRGCDPVKIINGSTLCSGAVDGITLYKYHEIPDFLRDNPYVVQGYRVALPFSTCFQRLATV